MSIQYLEQGSAVSKLRFVLREIAIVCLIRLIILTEKVLQIYWKSSNNKEKSFFFYVYLKFEEFFIGRVELGD